VVPYARCDASSTRRHGHGHTGKYGATF